MGATRRGFADRPRIARAQFDHDNDDLRSLRGKPRVALDTGSSTFGATEIRGRQTGGSRTRAREQQNTRSGKSFGINARDGGRTRTPLAGLRILSPVRLPVPPPRREIKSTTYASLTHEIAAFGRPLCLNFARELDETCRPSVPPAKDHACQ